MSLGYTGMNAPMTNGGTSFQARDQDGKNVAVQATADCIQDYGVGTVRAKGEEKYNAGQFLEGDTRIVTVTTTDFRNR
jgi:hypothetical protein